jgi:hypothetical protein
MTFQSAAGPQDQPLAEIILAQTAKMSMLYFFTLLEMFLEAV